MDQWDPAFTTPTPELAAQLEAVDVVFGATSELRATTGAGIEEVHGGVSDDRSGRVHNVGVWASGSEAAVERLRTALHADDRLRDELTRLGSAPEVIVEFVTVDDAPDNTPAPSPPF